MRTYFNIVFITPNPLAPPQVETTHSTGWGTHSDRGSRWGKWDHRDLQTLGT